LTSDLLTDFQRTTKANRRKETSMLQVLTLNGLTDWVLSVQLNPSRVEKPWVANQGVLKSKELTS